MSIMDDQLSVPRDLSEEETAKLRKFLRSQLSISTDDDEEDADNLLDYAVDMIESGENVGHVTEELKFMEMPVCDDDAAQKLGECLTKFFNELDLDGGGGSSGGEEKSNKSEVPVSPKPTPFVTQQPVSVAPPKPTPVVTPPPPKATPTPTPVAVVRRSAPSRSSYSATTSSYTSAPTPPTRSMPSRSASVSSPSSNGSQSWMSPKINTAVDASDCKSTANRRQSEMKEAFGGGGQSVKDRMKAFNNNTKVNFDPVHFAVNQNKAEKGENCIFLLLCKNSSFSAG